jgi:RNA polymerase sigma-70 factor (ECF subfamily)
MSDFTDELINLLPRLRRFALATAKSSHDADDLLQAAVERALRHAAAWQPGSRLDSWMFKIIQNLWLDELRAHRRKTEPLDAIDTHSNEDGRVTMTEQLHLQEVQAAMQALPHDQRCVIALVVLEGMSYKQVAETLDIPLGTVMSRLARARSALAARLGQGASTLKVASP